MCVHAYQPFKWCVIVKVIVWSLCLLFIWLLPRWPAAPVHPSIFTPLHLLIHFFLPLHGNMIICSTNFFLIRRTHGSLLNPHTIPVEKIELLRKEHRCTCVNPFRPYHYCLQLSVSQWRCPGFLHNSSQCVHLTFGINRNVYPLVHGHFCLMW